MGCTLLIFWSQKTQRINRSIYKKIVKTISFPKKLLSVISQNAGTSSWCFISKRASLRGRYDARKYTKYFPYYKTDCRAFWDGSTGNCNVRNCILGSVSAVINFCSNGDTWGISPISGSNCCELVLEDQYPPNFTIIFVKQATLLSLKLYKIYINLVDFWIIG